MRCDKYVDLLLRGTGFWLSLVAWQTKVVLVPVSHCNVIWAIPGSPIISDYTRFKALEMEKRSEPNFKASEYWQGRGRLNLLNES